MWIVRLALRRPYTIAVFAIFIMIMGVLSLKYMMVDIFPTIDIPVVGVVWSYPGLSAEDMERRVVLLDERAISSTVNGVSRIESQSTAGIGIMKIYFEPGSDIGAAIAQISSIGNTVVHFMPAGISAPVVIQFNASNLPVAQITASSETLPEEKLFDYSLNFIRIRLFTIPGLATPAPYGGRNRQITVAIDPRMLASRGLSATDIVTALQNSNVIIPTGTARLGTREYSITSNASPSAIDQFKRIPVKVVGGVPIMLGDVATVGDGFAQQSNIVRVNGHRAIYLAILKKSNASTLAVVDAAKEAIPEIQASAPQGMNLRLDFDQSKFVRASINSVMREAIIAAVLVSLLILLFLGSWRSVVIVCTSIPLAIMTSIIGLMLTGNSINIMTLGGLSLAIGMLVDDATVEVENIHRNRLLGKPLTVAILDGARQIAVPAIMATLAICIVFFPVVLLTGPAKFLFTPMALAVVIAMMASYFLSRTLVPALARMLMGGEALHQGARGVDHVAHDTNEQGNASGPIGRMSRRFNIWRDTHFDRFRDSYGRLLERMLHVRGFVLLVTGVLIVATMFLPGIIGSDFFPTTDTGLMKMHMRAPTGTRLEETERLVSLVESDLRQIIPPDELQTINDNIGIPTSYNLAFVQSDNASSMDAEFLVALKEEHHPTEKYQEEIRKKLAQDFPGSTFYFQSADIVSQVLNFGLSSPVDVQIQDPNLQEGYEYARKLRDGMRKIPGTADVVIKQVLDYPTLRVDVDRQRAAQLGLNERDVASTMLISLASSGLVAPSFFLNPENNVNYSVVVQTPIDKVKTVENLLSTPITAPAPLNQPARPATPTDIPRAASETLGNIAQLTTVASPNQISHYTVQRILDVTSNIQGRDLGSVASDIQSTIDKFGKLPKGMKIAVRGQNEVKTASFTSLGFGIILAIALVYLLMVILFQSWLDPFIIMIAVPGALVGILWMLALTGTTINVVSLMGSIMAVGIAVSNSILLVTFANQVRVEEGLSAFDAALEAGKTRLRPVLMTALAMILGMLPMALASGEQNAPLGRAVIGGLLFATVVTLFIVPIVYSLLRRKLPTMHLLEAKFAAEETGKEFDPAADREEIARHAAAGHTI
jgi:multidrug efflux pump subunit AcrB